MTTWLYVRSEYGPSYELFTVGFYAPDGTWHTDSDHSDRESAARRVNYLNGAGQVDAFAAAGRADGGSDG